MSVSFVDKFSLGYVFSYNDYISSARFAQAVHDGKSKPVFVCPLGEERPGVRIVKPAECIVKTIRICGMVAACAAGVNIRGRYEARERSTGLSGRNQSDLRPLRPTPQNLCAAVTASGAPV